MVVKFFKRIEEDEDGAVTVDWVVLTAATVGIAVALIGSLRTSINGVGTKITTYLDGMTISE